MAKQALCVGINDYPGTNNDLSGCVNDANAWAALLAEHYGFARTDVKILLDAQATKSAIMAGLKALLAKSKAGDILVFMLAGHGTYVADESGDEEDYDEAMCPHDCDRNLILDDELRELFGGMANGVSLTVIADCCHSGTITRAAEGGGGADDRRARFLNPQAIGRKALADPRAAAAKRAAKPTQTAMKEVLLSGCSPTEYSYDARLGDKYHGAMTFHALKAIAAANHKISWADLHTRTRSLLDAARYPQHPQLEGTAANKKKPIFT
jgi:hypothetical protein